MRKKVKFPIIILILIIIITSVRHRMSEVNASKPLCPSQWKHALHGISYNFWLNVFCSLEVKDQTRQR